MLYCHALHSKRWQAQSDIYVLSKNKSTTNHLKRYWKAKLHCSQLCPDYKTCSSKNIYIYILSSWCTFAKKSKRKYRELKFIQVLLNCFNFYPLWLQHLQNHDSNIPVFWYPSNELVPEWLNSPVSFLVTKARQMQKMEPKNMINCFGGAPWLMV